MYRQTSGKLLEFLKKSPTAFHAVEQMKLLLEQEGYEQLREQEAWNVQPGGNYYIVRNGSSIIAVSVGSELDQYGFHIAASHTDCPAFKVKEHAELEVKGKYIQLNTEGYGGMLCGTWFDRPLSVAGRLLVKNGDHLETKLVQVDRDLLLIPSLAIHMNRKANDGMAYNKQIDMIPLFAAGAVDTKDAFRKLIAKEAGVEPDAIYGSDLYLYNRTEPTIWGANEEFISSAHLDDLQCGYASLQGFLQGSSVKDINVFACLDNEEVGSGTKQGAAGTFLRDVLYRINGALGKSIEEYYRAVANSFMISADNAHALHPNHPEKSDATNQVYMNEGIVIKSHAGQKYTSDAVSIAIFRKLCQQADVPVQFFANRSDEAGGSTLGNIAMSQVSMNCVDIGLPQLAMHSAYETAGVRDTWYLIRAMKEFYSNHIQLKSSKESDGWYFVRNN